MEAMLPQTPRRCWNVGHKREGPRTSFGGFQVGLDGRIGRRIGVSTYLETLPGLVYTPNMGTYVQFIFAFQSIGTEVTFWF